MDIPWITTKKGDKGLTTLGNGEKVPKDHPRVELYGTLDECQAAIGIARAHCAFEEINAHLLEIENMLGTLMGHLSLFPGVPCPEYQALEKIISHVGTIVGEKKTYLFKTWRLQSRLFSPLGTHYCPKGREKGRQALPRGKD
ncbi:ATP:cob(I)alamin adenosyltransferase [Thermovirga lienii]|uniref:ATP:cob(I)alamin adenosyltransferase n=1 Tax=Thermovirga lienii TaxID=336261 RepID=UPI002FE2B1B2